MAEVVSISVSDSIALVTIDSPPSMPWTKAFAQD